MPKENKTAEALLALASAVKSLETKITEKLDGINIVDIKHQTTSVGVNTTMKTPFEPIENVAPLEPEVPFPQEWRDIIDTVLNAKFKAKVTYLENANFELTVLVPKEYSNCKEAEWKMNGNTDPRVKRIPNYLGPDGVRQYCELIAENLGIEARVRITNDRAQLTK